MAITPQPLTQIDTYTGVATGVTATGLGNPLKAYPIQCISIHVLGTGGVPTSWDVRLEGSTDGGTFIDVSQHVTETGDGTTLSSGITTASLVYFRSRVNALVLGPATNIVVTLVAEQLAPVSLAGLPTAFGKSITYVSVAQGAAGTTVLASASLGKRHKIVGATLVMSGTGTVKFSDGVGDLTGAMDVVTNGGFVWSTSVIPYQQTAANSPLNLVTTVGAAKGVVQILTEL